MLEVRDIETSYGAVQALFGVDLEVREGEFVALMGRNGMGKSTLIRTICRLTPQTAGVVQFEDRDTRGLRPFEVARLGIGLVPEGRRCFANLSVEENLLATARSGDWNLPTVTDLFPRLAERRDQMAATLSGGEQQMLAIGRALMTNPKLLILDEATEGLAPLIRAEIWAVIGRLKAQGLALLVVDKTLAEILPLADRCTILENGRNAWQGTPDALDAKIRTDFLGI